MAVALCTRVGCRRRVGHPGSHEPYPASAWEFLAAKDKNKLTKAGFATPRGGEKGAYQNHVTRNNKVIVPFERLAGIDLTHFRNGYVIRLYPDQYFLSLQQVRPEFPAN